MARIRIAENLELPTEAITQTFGILAKRGVGKTYLMLRLSEEFLREKLQIIIADPVGVCWGLRSSADGKGPGLSIVIFGGDHADVPLEKEAGAVIADIAIEERISMVLDLSHFRKGEQVSFMAAFAERLYHKNRNPLHLLLDEADMFAPQRPMPGEQRMLGAIEDLVRRGRARGIGVTLVTQRAAVLNKNVLTQLEVLVTMRTISPQDQDAIEAWVKAHGTDEQRKEMMGSLASLPIGTAWFWSPGWLDIFRKVKVSKRITFDSSSTPKIGGKVIAPKTMAEVNLDELRKRMAATIERAKEEDPRELKKRIAELQRQLRTSPKQTVLIQTPCNHGPEIQALKRQNSEVKASYQTAMGVIKRIEKVSLDALGKAHETIANLAASVNEKKFEAIAISPPSSIRDLRRERPASAQPGTAAPGNNSDITPPQQKILNALAAFEAIGLEIVAKPAVAAFCRVSSTSGGYFNNLGALRSKGLIIYPNSNQASLTPEGRVHARLSDPISGLADLHAGWLGIITEPQKKILKELIRIYPHDIDKSELAERVKVSPTSGGYFNNLGRLRTLMAIEYPTPGKARASDLLFPEGLR